MLPLLISNDVTIGRRPGNDFALYYPCGPIVDYDGLAERQRQSGRDLACHEITAATRL